MSPAYFNAGCARVFGVDSAGYLFGNRSVAYAYGIRPVINIASDITIKSGNGTSSTPYEI